MVVVSTEALTFFFSNYDGVFGFHCRGVGSGHVMAEPDPKTWHFPLCCPRC
jgi:hypothetical protein